jgi:hypothetical protein
MVVAATGGTILAGVASTGGSSIRLFIDRNLAGTLERCLRRGQQAIVKLHHFAEPL